MKFSEMKYERPDLDKVLAQCEEYAKKMAAAQSGEELVQLYREENAMMAHYHTASCLASIHYTQDTRDEYWSGEQEWFDATGPAVSNAARNVAEAILSNPHAKALEEAFGTRILPSLRNLVLSMDDRVIELQKEENALTSAYQKLYGGAMAELDGKQLTIPQLTLYKQSTDPAMRRKAYEADITFGTNNEFGFDYLRDNMAISPKDLVQRKHNYSIVDEVDSVLIDDARTPLIISGPIPRGEEQLFEQFRPNVEVVVNAQKDLCSKLLIEAKKKMASDDQKVVEEGSILLYRSFKGYPRNKALIKFLSEQGVKAQMLKTEEYFMSENMRHMHEATDELYFVIDEKNNSIELTDKGIDLLTGKTDDPTFFVLPDITSQLSQLENMTGTEEEKQAQKDEILANYSVKSERVHTINQLLKAYTLFEKDDEYVVMDNKVMIVDEQTGRIMDGRRYSDGLHQAIEAKERVKVEAATQTFATITLQNYFRMYHKLRRKQASSGISTNWT